MWFDSNFTHLINALIPKRTPITIKRTRTFITISIVSKIPPFFADILCNKSSTFIPISSNLSFLSIKSDFYSRFSRDIYVSNLLTPSGPSLFSIRCFSYSWSETPTLTTGQKKFNFASKYSGTSIQINLGFFTI